MNKNILLLAAAISFITSCSDNDDEWRYGEKQILNSSEWIRIGEIPEGENNFSPIRFPKEQTLSFGEESYILTTKGSIYVDNLNSMRDTTITTSGSYVYNHPTLLLTPEVGNKAIEAWITPLNRISFQDSGDFFEFKRK